MTKLTSVDRWPAIWESRSALIDAEDEEESPSISTDGSFGWDLRQADLQEWAEWSVMDG